MNQRLPAQLQPRILNALQKQQIKLMKNPTPGVLFKINEDGDLTDIQADIVGPVGTPYHGGVFRCKIVLDSGFPAQPPRGYFLTKIFHPNVAVPTGDICVNTLKKDWDPSRWSLQHIFEVIKCLLIVPFPESSLNEEAGRQFMEDYTTFQETARVYTEVHARPSESQKEQIAEMAQKEAETARKEEKPTMLTAGPAGAQKIQLEHQQTFQFAPTTVSDQQTIPMTLYAQQQPIRMMQGLVPVQRQEQGGVLHQVTNQTFKSPRLTHTLQQDQEGNIIDAEGDKKKDTHHPITQQQHGFFSQNSMAANYTQNEQNARRPGTFSMLSGLKRRSSFVQTSDQKKKRYMARF